LYLYIMSDDTKINNIIKVTVDNEFGALARIVSLFSARGYNISSLSVAEVDHEKAVSVITIETHCKPSMAHLIVKILEKLIPVRSAILLPQNVEKRYIALFSTSKTSDEITNITKLRDIKIHIISTNEGKTNIEVSADSEDSLDSFLKVSDAFNITKSGCLVAE
jgi:acetolactate synthase-1/3 small subunit